MAGKFYYQPNAGNPLPVYIRYRNPAKALAWIHYQPTGLRWGADEWGNFGWLIDGALVREDGTADATWGPILLAGVTEVRFTVPE